MDRFQTFPLLPVITVAQAFPLSLGMFLGDPAAAWISIAAGGPSTGGQHFTHAVSIRKQSS